MQQEVQRPHAPVTNPFRAAEPWRVRNFDSVPFCQPPRRTRW